MFPSTNTNIRKVHYIRRHDCWFSRGPVQLTMLEQSPSPLVLVEFCQNMIRIHVPTGGENSTGEKNYSHLSQSDENMTTPKYPTLRYMQFENIHLSGVTSIFYSHVLRLVLGFMEKDSYNWNNHNHSYLIYIYISLTYTHSPFHCTGWRVGLHGSQRLMCALSRRGRAWSWTYGQRFLFSPYRRQGPSEITESLGQSIQGGIRVTMAIHNWALIDFKLCTL